MIAVKGNMAKLTANVDHLWAVKEIEYGNVMGILETTKRQWYANFHYIYFNTMK